MPKSNQSVTEGCNSAVGNLQEIPTYFKGLQVDVKLRHLIVQTIVIHRKRAYVLTGEHTHDQHRVTESWRCRTKHREGTAGTAADRVTVLSSLAGASPMTPVCP